MEIYEEIKSELIHRFNQKAKSLNKISTNATGLKKLEQLAKKFDKNNINKLQKTINETINEILDERNVEFKDGEKDAFISYINPTVKDLLIKYLKN